MVISINLDEIYSIGEAALCTAYAFCCQYHGRYIGSDRNSEVCRSYDSREAAERAAYAIGAVTNINPIRFAARIDEYCRRNGWRHYPNQREMERLACCCPYYTA